MARWRAGREGGRSQSLRRRLAYHGRRGKREHSTEYVRTAQPPSGHGCVLDRPGRDTKAGQVGSYNSVLHTAHGTYTYVRPYIRRYYTSIHAFLCHSFPYGLGVSLPTSHDRPPRRHLSSQHHAKDADKGAPEIAAPRSIAQLLTAVNRAGAAHYPILSLLSYSSFPLCPCARRTGWSPWRPEPSTVLRHRRSLKAPCKPPSPYSAPSNLLGSLLVATLVAAQTSLVSHASLLDCCIPRPFPATHETRKLYPRRASRSPCFFFLVCSRPDSYRLGCVGQAFCISPHSDTRLRDL